MFSSNKILSIIFILLFLLLIGEVVYLMNIKNSPKVVNQVKKNDLPFHPSTQTSSEAYKKLKVEPAIHPETLKMLARFMKSSSSEGSLYILQEQTTKVLGIEARGACVEDRRNGVLYPGQICFPFAMKLEDKILPEGYVWTYLTESNIKKTTVYIKNKEGQKAATLKDIQPNDLITTVEKWDPSIAFDINKLKEYLDEQIVELTIYINRDI